MGGWSAVEQLEGRETNPAVTCVVTAEENCGMYEMVERLQCTRYAEQCGSQAADVDKGRGCLGTTASVW